MLVRQSKDTFIRVTDNFGYIYNQTTQIDRMYNETGMDYLSSISRNPQDINQIVLKQLYQLYEGVSYEELYQDFFSFVIELSNLGFLVIGDTPQDLDKKEIEYKAKTKSFLEYSQSLEVENISTTQTFTYSSQQIKPYLMSIQFELTSKCNERCIHCYIPNSKKDSGKEMPLSLFKDIIKQFHDMGGLQVSLSGGEILLHKNIWEIVNLCREYDMQIVLLSNLYHLNDEDIKKIKQANVSMVQTSLYSMNPEIHDYITKIKGSYDKIKRAIELLVKNNIPTSISCPILKSNKDCYVNILEYAHSLGIKAQTDFILMARENLEIDNLENRISIKESEKIIKLILENNMRDTNDFIKKNSKKNLKALLSKDMSICAAGINNLCISSNGDAYPCNGWQSFKAGNLCLETLKDIWTNSPVLKKLRSIKRSDFPKCIDCNAAEYCSICMARNCNESGGDPLQLNPHFCEIAHLNKKIYEESFKSM